MTGWTRTSSPASMRGLDTILVLTGVTQRHEINRFPYLPTRVVDSIADLVGEI